VYGPNGIQDSISVGANQENTLFDPPNSLYPLHLYLEDLAPAGNDSGAIGAIVNGSAPTGSADVQATFQIVPDGGEQIGDPVIIQFFSKRVFALAFLRAKLGRFEPT
jgi:hypothetical protein